ncbi:cyclin-dependent protein kinase inhibitor SMR6-like [Herrania umbratica]|uniref:Cyclin-dependent protein kinase inhibitor SMR6-like n=1 Tax=Herrania umbratica TaxID=108875 RepID=A0A6J0ZYE6_9ROSI|nr:cyclin-dependent protein kinase inhibitor SMR6-like [Herrania umbratica]
MVINVYTKEDTQRILSDKIAKLTVNVEEGECNGEAAPVADSETCRTPTSKEHRIPEPLTCPPAPRKRKGSFAAEKNEPKKIVDDKEIETIFSPDQVFSETSCGQ